MTKRLFLLVLFFVIFSLLAKSILGVEKNRSQVKRKIFFFFFYKCAQIMSRIFRTKLLLSAASDISAKRRTRVSLSRLRNNPFRSGTLMKTLFQCAFNSSIKSHVVTFHSVVIMCGDSPKIFSMCSGTLEFISRGTKSHLL